MFLHFEMIPDRLARGVREPIRVVPAGALQFEVGSRASTTRSASGSAAGRMRLSGGELALPPAGNGRPRPRRSDRRPAGRHRKLRRGFDRLVGLGPQEIQWGSSSGCGGRRSCGTIRNGDGLQPARPYEVLRTKQIDFPTMQRMRRFARYWDLIANSGKLRGDDAAGVGCGSRSRPFCVERLLFERWGGTMRSGYRPWRNCFSGS